MDKNIVIEVKNVSKIYRLGEHQRYTVKEAAQEALGSVFGSGNNDGEEKV